MENKQIESFVLFNVNKTDDFIEKESPHQLILLIIFIILTHTHAHTHTHTYIIDIHNNILLLQNNHYNVYH